MLQLLLAACAALSSPLARRFAKQLQAFEHHLFPPADLELRNAVSRKDGYWPFVAAKEEPPTQLT